MGDTVAQQSSMPVGVPLLQCRFCSSVPAANGGFHAFQNVTVWFRIRSTAGPFCRDCGTAIFRHMQQATLTLGWYGIAGWVAPIVLVLNLFRSDAATNLGAPGPAPGAAARRPMDPGKPLWQRPKAVAGALAPFVLILLVILLVILLGLLSGPPG